MSQKSLRNWMKYGPLTGLFAHVRRIKRRLRRQPYHHIERFAPMPLTADALREQVILYPDNARLYYSLALAYLEPILADLRAAVSGPEPEAGRAGNSQEGVAERVALACLRCAQACNMEASERIQLYRALAVARLGETEYARRLAESLDREELTVTEQTLRESILEGSIVGVPPQILPARPQWEQAREQVCSHNPDSLLVIGDDLAVSACWANVAVFVLVSERVTGLCLEQVAAIRKHFSVGVATVAEQERARKAGLCCEHWVTIPVVAGGEC